MLLQAQILEVPQRPWRGRKSKSRLQRTCCWVPMDSANWAKIWQSLLVVGHKQEEMRFTWSMPYLLTANKPHLLSDGLWQLAQASSTRFWSWWVFKENWSFGFTYKYKSRKSIIKLKQQETLDKLAAEGEEEELPPKGITEGEDPDFGEVDDDFGLGSLRQDDQSEVQDEVPWIVIFLTFRKKKKRMKRDKKSWEKLNKIGWLPLKEEKQRCNNSNNKKRK